MVFHVLNRGVGRMRLFLKEGDFQAFERTVEKTLESCPMRICAYCLMSNHWHLVLWPERHRDLGRFMQKLTITHVRNWQVAPIACLSGCRRHTRHRRPACLLRLTPP